MSTKYRIATLLLVVTLLVGPLASTVMAADPVPCTHKVRWGESLYWIAWLYDVKIPELADLNGIDNWNLISTGAVLEIPGSDCTEYVEHKVVWGDTLLTLAAKYGVTVWDIAKRNGLFNWDLIFAGDTLMIPGVVAGGETSGDMTEAEDEAVIEDDEADETGEAGEADEAATEDEAVIEDGEAEAADDTPAAIPPVQAAIIITLPIMDDEITSPVTIKGFGSGFENNLAVDILDQNGTIIGQGNVTITPPDGESVGPFEGTVEFNVDTAQLGRIAVMSISPRDGAIEELTSVSVYLAP